MEFILSKHASISATVLHHFPERPQRESSHGARVRQNTTMQAGNMKSVSHFVATPWFLLLPFHSFQTLTLCKMHDNCPSCVSLNLAATMSLFTAVWHWTLCLENMCVWKWEGKGRESDPFPLCETLAVFFWARWVHVVSVTDQESFRFSESQKWLLQRERIFLYEMDKMNVRSHIPAESWSLQLSGGPLDRARVYQRADVPKGCYMGVGNSRIKMTILLMD